MLPIGVSEDRRTIAFQVVSEEGPSAERPSTSSTSSRGPVTSDLAADGVELGVTGQAVANIEVSERLAGALPLYIALVIGLSLVLLTIVFRSVLVPILATAGFLLSVGASFGVVVAVYQWGWLGGVFDVHNPGAVMSFMPTLLIGILFGLAMDYQMFLVSGMRESYVHGQTARAAVRSGFASGARVVAAAALIMVAVFSGFVFSHMTMARPIGLGLAVGVLPRRLPDPDDADARGDVAARRQDLVDARLARPAAAAPRRRGLGARGQAAAGSALGRS